MTLVTVRTTRRDHSLDTQRNIPFKLRASLVDEGISAQSDPSLDGSPSNPVHGDKEPLYCHDLRFGDFPSCHK